MKREKQIEEMARDLENHTCMSQYQAEIASKMLYIKGYRKIHDDNAIQCVCYALGCQAAEKIKSEVALEVINNALSKIQIMISAIKEQEENGNITEFNGGAKTALEVVFKDIAELKKKDAEGCDG